MACPGFLQLLLPLGVLVGQILRYTPLLLLLCNILLLQLGQVILLLVQLLLILCILFDQLCVQLGVSILKGLDFHLVKLLCSLTGIRQTRTLG